MKWASEARLILIVRVNVNVLVLLQATEVVVLLARTNNAFLDLIGLEYIVAALILLLWHHYDAPTVITLLVLG